MTSNVAQKSGMAADCLSVELFIMEAGTQATTAVGVLCACAGGMCVSE